MWSKIFLIAVLLCNMSISYADAVPADADTSQDNTMSSGVDIDYSQNSDSYPKITQMEKKLYSKSYQHDDVYNRLDRLEKSLYGRTRSDADLSTRVDDLSDKLKVSAMPGYMLEDISAMERVNFNKVFRDDTPDNRLERLEYHLIGAVQDGSYQDRLYKLKSLTQENTATHYLDENAYAYQGDDYYASDKDRKSSYSTPHVRKPISTTVQNFFMFVAPFLLGLL